MAKTIRAAIGGEKEDDSALEGGGFLGYRNKRITQSLQGPTSLFIFAEDNWIRRNAKAFIEWGPFEYFILLTIIGKFLTFFIIQMAHL